MAASRVLRKWRNNADAHGVGSPMRALLTSLTLLAGCWHSPAPEPPAAQSAPVAPVASPASKAAPSVMLVGEAEWEACAAAMDTLPGGLECDGQSLEGGVPLRYQDLPAVAADGSVIAVVEERDGWGHVRPGIRLIDRTGRSRQWLALDGTGDVARANIAQANRELATRAWVALEAPRVAVRELSDELSETTLTLDGVTAVYQRRHDGNVRLPPSWIRVTDARGRVLAERRDTESAWDRGPACNMPRFELVGASARPGVVLFATRLGMGGHNCDGVVQSPVWHVLAFE
jgi:hypothetical protein